MIRLIGLLFIAAVTVGCTESSDQPSAPARIWENEDYLTRTVYDDLTYLYCPAYDKQLGLFKTHLVEVEAIEEANIGKWSFAAVTNRMNSRHLTAPNLWETTPVSASIENYYAPLLETSDADSYTGWAYLERSNFCGIDLKARVSIDRDTLALNVMTEVSRDINKRDGTMALNKYHAHFTCDDIQWYFSEIGKDVNTSVNCKIVPDKESFDTEIEFGKKASIERAEITMKTNEDLAIRSANKVKGALTLKEESKVGNTRI